MDRHFLITQFNYNHVGGTNLEFVLVGQKVFTLRTYHHPMSWRKPLASDCNLLQFRR
jgi:hypothetical protein